MEVTRRLSWWSPDDPKTDGVIDFLSSWSYIHRVPVESHISLSWWKTFLSYKQKEFNFGHLGLLSSSPRESYLMKLRTNQEREAFII